MFRFALSKIINRSGGQKYILFIQQYDLPGTDGGIAGKGYAQAGDGVLRCRPVNDLVEVVVREFGWHHADDDTEVMKIEVPPFMLCSKASGVAPPFGAF